MSETTKVVINGKFGGFSLSDEATREYLRRKDLEWTEEVFHGLTTFSVVGDDGWYSREIPRTDPDLVAIVEEWGDRANGSHADLEVCEIAKGTAFVIREYDGLESIQTRESIDWEIA